MDAGSKEVKIVSGDTEVSRCVSYVFSGSLTSLKIMR